MDALGAILPDRIVAAAISPSGARALSAETLGSITGVVSDVVRYFFRSASADNGMSGAEQADLAAANRRFLDKSLEHEISVIATSDEANIINPVVPLSTTFEKVRVLGTGAYGQVALWRSRSTGQHYAIKEFTCPSKGRGDAEHEFAIGTKLNHPNIVSIHNMVLKSGAEGVRPFLVMEYVDGTVGQHVHHSDLDLALKSKLAEQIESALAYMQEQAVEPQDVYSGNVMISKQGDWKFIDLGLYTHKHSARVFDLWDCCDPYEYAKARVAGHFHLPLVLSDAFK